MSSLVRKFVLAMLALAIIASSIGTVSAYNQGATIDYARSHYSSGVPGSWWFGDNDCTNFVSHSLSAGGIKMTANDPNRMWYYITIWEYSPSWTQVQPFRDFMLNSGRAREYPLTGLDVSNRPAGINVGDIIQADGVVRSDIAADGRWEHTMIITQIVSNNIYVTYRSNNVLNAPMSEMMSKFPKAKFRVLIIRNDA